MNTNHWKTLGCILGLHLLMCMVLGPSTPTTDDLCYVQDAYKVSDGTYSFNSSPKTQRLGMILPTYGAISTLGNSPFAISLYPFICSILSIFLVYSWLRHLKPLAIVGSLLLALNITQITYSTALFPDVTLSLLMFGIVSAFYYRNDERRLLAFVAGIIMVMGFFVKQLIVVLIPLLCYWVIKDLAYGKNIRFNLIFIATSIISGIIVFTAVYNHTGDWFFLISSVEEQHNRVFADLSGTALRDRLTWQPLAFLHQYPGFWPLLILSMPSIAIRTSNIRVELAKIYFLFLLAFFWLGTTSIKSYSPLLLLDRMWLPMIIPLCILSANTLNSIVNPQWKKVTYFLLVAFAFSSIVAFSNKDEGEALFYALIPCSLLVGQRLYNKKPGYENHVAFVLTMPFLLISMWFAISNSIYQHY